MPTLTMAFGASIRYNVPTGLRFQTDLTADEKYDALTAQYKVKFGTLIAPAAYLGENGTNGVFTKEALDALKTEKRLTSDTYIDIPYETDEWYDEYDNIRSFTGSVAEILPEHYTLEYVGIGYMSICLDEENDVWATVVYASFYGNDIKNNTRTVAEVAEAAVNDRQSVRDDICWKYEINDGNENGAWSPYTPEQIENLKKYFAEA